MKSPDFRALTTAPLNGAPASAALVAAHRTPTALFFVRSHAPTNPAPSAALRRDAVSVAGLVQHASIVDLTALPRTTVEATLQCAGNRRCGLMAHRDIPGEVPWTNDAIGTAVWEGVSLAAVLERAAVATPDARDLHVWFLGADAIDGKGGGAGFGASIPFAKATSPGVILADTMNGAPLAPDHGAPLRVIVPGYIGARSVKWLTEVRVERGMSNNHFQRAYSVPDAGAPDGHEILGALRTNSAIALDDGARLARGRTRVTGWAMAGGDATIERVECSADGGATWTSAQFTSPEKRHVWRLWDAALTLTPGSHELVCRAFDSAGGTQPARVEDVWNPKGYMNNCWHRVRVQVD